MAERSLEVWCFGRLAGRLSDIAAGPHFAYGDAWIADGMPPLSQSLPPDGTGDPSAARTFFGNLLPEGVPRELLARHLGISVGNDFALLAAIGGDTAGAVSLRRPGAQDRAPAREVRWLDDDELVALIDELPAARCTPTRTASTASRWPAPRTRSQSSWATTGVSD